MFRTKSNSGLWFAQKNTLDARKSEYSATRYNHRRSPVKSPLMIMAAAMALTMGSPAGAQDCKGAFAHPMVQCFAVEVLARMGSDYESPSAARQSFMNGWKPGRSGKHNLYSITTNQAAIIALFRVMKPIRRQPAPMPGVFPDYPAPVVRNAGGEREMVLMRWGMPSPPRRPPVTNIRNSSRATVAPSRSRSPALT